MTRVRLLPLLLLGALLWTSDAFAGCTTGNVLFENDLDGRGTDRNYTHGSRFSCISERLGDDSDIGHFAKSLEFVAFGRTFLKSSGDVRYALAAGQSMFTPEELSRTDLIVDDRPYAGWLFGTLALILGPGPDKRGSESAFQRLETIELTVGMVGPASGADETQKSVHKALDAPVPRGWDNQLHNEPGIVLSYEAKARSRARNVPGTGRWLEYDTMPSVGVELGNIHTYASGGLTFRVGRNLANDFGPPRIRPSVAGSEYYNPNPDETVSGYLFFSLGGRAVARNIFLDGNGFRDSHQVDKKYLVGDIQFGAVMSLFGRARVALTHIILSREFSEQDAHSQFSALSLSFKF